MKRKTWVIIFVIIVIVIILLLVIAFRNPKNKNRKQEMCPDGKTPIPSDGKCPQQSIDNAVADETGCIQPSSYTNFKFPIKFGMKDGGNVYENKQVSVLQRQLNTIYKAGLSVDGFFGCNTKKAVNKYLGTDEVGYSNNIWQLKPILG